jgi:hypothetical protein
LVRIRSLKCVGRCIVVGKRGLVRIEGVVVGMYVVAEERGLVRIEGVVIGAPSRSGGKMQGVWLVIVMVWMGERGWIAD